MMTPHEFAKDFITRWEGKLSLDPVDNGNWTGGKQGVGTLVGSNYGVTPAALASFRKVPVSAITKPVMAALSLDEAADIALANYYRAPRLDLLPWNRVSASVFDMGWGTGPKQAIKLLQRMVGTADDGIMGPATAGATKAMIDRYGEAFVSALWWMQRNAFYDQIIKTRPTNAKYERGWKNRSHYFVPGDAEGWWSRFAA